MFTAALHITAKIYKIPKCPSTDEWIKMYIYTYIFNAILLSVKKKEVLPSATI